MAWLNKFTTGTSTKLPLALAAAALAAATLVGCNVGKTETVSTTTGTTTSPGTGTAFAGGCTGSFVGGYEMPDHETRIAMRNRSLADRGIPVTGNDDIDNANAGGGPPDGGIWMAGSYAFETDSNCNIVNGYTFIFYTYQYDISGKINKDGTFSINWSGQGSVGEIEGKINANKTISGKFHHPAPDTYVHGVLNGTFTPNGKI